MTNLSNNMLCIIQDRPANTVFIYQRALAPKSRSYRKHKRNEKQEEGSIGEKPRSDNDLGKYRAVFCDRYVVKNCRKNQCVTTHFYTYCVSADIKQRMTSRRRPTTYVNNILTHIGTDLTSRINTRAFSESI